MYNIQFDLKILHTTSAMIFPLRGTDVVSLDTHLIFIFKVHPHILICSHLAMSVLNFIPWIYLRENKKQNKFSACI